MCISLRNSALYCLLHVIEDLILGSSGRILGVKLENIQIWNVYPKSGSAFKRDREIFFREIEFCAELSRMMTNLTFTLERI